MVHNWVLAPISGKEYPENIGHSLLEFFHYKEILVKNDLYIQGTPWVPLPLIVYLTRILDARQINALTKRMVKILLNFEKENVFTLHQVGLNSTTLFCHK